MLSMKLSRISLKMSDLEEYDKLKFQRDKDKQMDTTETTPQKTLSGNDDNKTLVPRSSTPEHNHS